MKRSIVFALLFLVPAASFADLAPRPDSRSTNFQIGLRSAYAVPFGKATDSAGDDLNQTIRRDVPVALDLNYRFSDEVYGGAYFSYGFGALGAPVAAACTSGSCSARTLRIGIGAYYHVMPKEAWDPWVGLTTGYEQASVSASGSGGSSSLTVSGFEILALQLGVDYRTSPLFSVGPFVSAGVGQYTKMDDGTTSSSIANTALHGWINFGMKLSFSP